MRQCRSLKTMLKDALRHSLRLFAESDETPAWLDCIAIEDEDDAVRVVFPHAYFGAYFAPYRERFEQALRHALARAPLRIRYDVRLTGRRLPRGLSSATAEAMPAGDTAQDFEMQKQIYRETMSCGGITIDNVMKVLQASPRYYETMEQQIRKNTK